MNGLKSDYLPRLILFIGKQTDMSMIEELLHYKMGIYDPSIELSFRYLSPVMYYTYGGTNHFVLFFLNYLAKTN